MSKQHVFRVRFKEMNGRDGGLGPVKSYKTTAANPETAAQRCRKKRVRIVSVRRANK
jgi:hypothetical protein